MIRSIKTHALAACILVCCAVASPAGAFESVLTLDSLSFVSFQNEDIILLPPGSTLTFEFGEPRPDGSIPFTISPDEVSIGPIHLDGSRTLQYGLASQASGTMRVSSNGRVIEMSADVSAMLVPGSPEPFTYSMPFTTETVSARNLAGDLEIEVEGMRLVEGAWYAQLVGGTVNRADAYPKPGSAVYSVLSGTFDSLPPIP